MKLKVLVLLGLCAAVAVANVDVNTHDGRVKEKKLSDEEHFDGDEHNPDYDHEAFLGDEAEEFNSLSPEESKTRLSEIVDKIDTDGDGIVTEQELIAWIKKAQHKDMEKEMEKQWAEHAPQENQDQEHMTWDDYQRTTYGYTAESEELGGTGEEVADIRRAVERDRRRWNAADLDKDGMLSKAEFSAFLRPEEADHLRDIVVLETIEDIDKDGDGKISELEYIGDMFEPVEGEDEPDWVQEEREQFRTVRDTDGNGFLDAEEVKAWILPPDYDHSQAETRHLIHEADVDGDGALSRDEILDKYDLFVGSQATDFGAALYDHDEL